MESSSPARNAVLIPKTNSAGICGEDLSWRLIRLIALTVRIGSILIVAPGGGRLWFRGGFLPRTAVKRSPTEAA